MQRPLPSPGLSVSDDLGGENSDVARVVDLISFKAEPIAKPPSWRWWYENSWVPGAACLGVVCGLVQICWQGTDAGISVGHRISALLGWTYFCMWSVSFYPQIFENISRKSVKGLSLEFQLLNFVGFSCYFVYNGGLYWSPLVREEYSAAHNGNANVVKLNDVAFAGHAALLTLVTLVQIAIYYDYPKLVGCDKALRYAVLAGLVTVVAVGGFVAFVISSTSEDTLDWLTYLSCLASVKVAITLIKYCPQVWLNARRKSTVGWNIHNVLLDFFGGMLSVAQLVLDAWLAQDWTAISGDPAKLLLGNISMLFDIVFMVQHFVLYPEPIIVEELSKPLLVA
eukprot:TRINITY_DN5536_c0_g1_i2.p1 TRINITY_DN5536_c0_g1~~TRINITY_DN5536_c0_g1_i2.p1  ORF type:complete len:339 (+),score=43.68 TRINITY_DN5536_c0_g1_i2:57-1073(+)